MPPVSDGWWRMWSRGQGSGFRGQDRKTGRQGDTETRRHGAYQNPAPDELIPDARPLIPELRAFLRSRLPDYMIPAAFVLLDALPLQPNGKIDRQRLPAPGDDRPELEQQFVAPQTPVETLLAEIWSQTLGVKRVGAHDNFFELGGDSILSLQIVARANAIGLRLTPKQLFQHQTIAELSRVVDTLPALQVQQGLVTGALPLSPIQRRFFELELPERQHWNQSLLLEPRQALKPELVAQALKHLLAHHDALRMRFARDESEAGWQQINADLGATVPFTYVDLAGLAIDQQRCALESASAMLQASLDLARGPLLRVTLFELAAAQPGRLLIVVHHLVVDGVSWRILLEDLQTVYAQLSRAEAVRLPPKTTAFKHWVERQSAYASSEALDAERRFWLAKPPTPLIRLPLDYPAGRAANTEASARTLSVALDDDETSALLHEVPQVYHTQINDVLLTALAQTFARRVGRGTLLIDLEGQGREDLFDDVDLSRTVGWFTTVFPVRLSIDPSEHPGEQLKSVKEQLRRIPQRGIGYGMLRYGADADAASLCALPQAEIMFNYLGQFDQVIAASTLFSLAQEASGPARSGAGKRSHLLEINGMIVEGRLRLDWTYSRNIHRRARIEQLAQDFLEALRACIAHCLSPVAGGYTPSDFAEFQWSQADLDIITRSIDKVSGEA